VKLFVAVTKGFVYGNASELVSMRAIFINRLLDSASKTSQDFSVMNGSIYRGNPLSTTGGGVGGVRYFARDRMTFPSKRRRTVN
jgi:hypothetical protein